MPTANAGGLDRVGGCRRKGLGVRRVFRHLQIDHGSLGVRRRHAPRRLKKKRAGVASQRHTSGANGLPRLMVRFFTLSEHADGERRGPCVDLKVP